MVSPVSSSAHRVRLREQRQGTRLEILAAAEAFLRERPYRELSVDAVMAGTDLTRTAFYRHFDDVTDLVLRLMEEVTGELFAIAERWGETAGSDYPLPARRALAQIVDFFARHGQLMRAIADAKASDEPIESAYRGWIEAFVDLTAQTFDRLQAAGQLDVPDTHAAARALNLMNEAYLLEEFGREPTGDRDAVLATLETIWLRVAGPSARD